MNKILRRVIPGNFKRSLLRLGLPNNSVTAKYMWRLLFDKGIPLTFAERWSILRRFTVIDRGMVTAHSKDELLVPAFLILSMVGGAPLSRPGPIRGLAQRSSALLAGYPTGGYMFLIHLKGCLRMMNHLPIQLWAMTKNSVAANILEPLMRLNRMSPALASRMSVGMLKAFLVTPCRGSPRKWWQSSVILIY